MRFNIDTGSFGENAAAAFLSGSGYSLIERNCRIGRLGEIDIIAVKDGMICFIEVKTRTNSEFGSPAEAVTKDKRRRLRKLASAYLSGKGDSSIDSDIRFDVVEVAVEICGEGYKISNINFIENAF